MSKPGKPKGKKGKGLPGDREEETRFIEGGADTGQKTGHAKSRGATAVPRGGDGPMETSSSTDHGASSEVDQSKKKKKTSGPFKFTRTLSLGRSSSHSPKPSSKKNVQSPTSSLATVSSASKQSEEAESAPVRKPSTVSSCDSQANGGPVSPTIEQIHSQIQELEQKLLNSEDTNSQLEEELQRRDQDHQQALANLEEKHDAALAEKVEVFRKSQQQQQAGKEVELEARENQHKLEMVRINKQHEAELENKVKNIRAVFWKQLGEKDAARVSETRKLREKLAQKEKQFNEVVQTQESQLQVLQRKLREKEDELQTKLGEEDPQSQNFVQKVEKQLQTQFLEEKERHAQEKQQIIDDYESQLQEATQQREVEKNRLLSESQLLQQEQKRSLEEMADKVRQYEEQQQDVPQQSVQGTDQVTKDHEVQMEQLKQQHIRELEEKDRQLTESRSRLQEVTQRYDKEIRKRTLEFQTKLADTERRHKAQLDDQKKQYDLSLAEMRKGQHDVLELQVAHVKRSHAKELQRKEEENTHKMEQEIQQREQVVRQEFQQREQVLQQKLQQKDQVLQQELQQKDQVLQQELQQKEQKLCQQDTQLRRYEQEVIEKNAKIAQLESYLSSSEPPSEHFRGEHRDWSAELSKLRKEVGALRRENDDLKGEVEARKAEAILWKEDFHRERHDRQQAAGRIDDERARRSVQDQKVFDELQKWRTRIHQYESENKKLRDEISVYQGEMKNYQQVITDYEEVQLQLVQHKEQVANFEQLFQTQQREHKAQLEQTDRLQRTQLEDVHRQLKKANQQLDQAVTDNEKLHDDVLAKTQQVKQYKKQVDGLKAAVETQVTAKQEIEVGKTQQINDLRRQLQDSMERLHHQEVSWARADQQLRGEIQRLSNQLQLRSQSDELAPYHVPYFKAVAGEQKGSGSYGSVHLIEVNGIPCIAKQLLDILVGRNREEDVGIQQRDAIQRKFRNECILLSRLKHPNIVQFMGVHCDHHDPSNLTLIMEYLPMDLEKCLKLYANLPLSMIISILLDVSYGLLHLHSQTPPIIHRDLTAANILLTCDIRAKIADLGVSKILEHNPLHASAQSALPGAFGYMPPEALVEKPQYGTKLDVFSFGVVSLYAAIQEFPLMHEDFSVAAVQNKEVQIQKRRVWIREMGTNHCLHQLVIQCLKDDPVERPSTDSINAMLKQLSDQHPKKFQNVLQMYSQIETLEQQVSASHQQLSEHWAQTVQLQREKEELLRREMGQNAQQIHPMHQGANVQSPTAVNTQYYNYRAPTLQPADGQAQSQYGLRPSYPVPRPRHNRSPYPPQQ